MNEIQIRSPRSFVAPSSEILSWIYDGVLEMKESSVVQ